MDNGKPTGQIYGLVRASSYKQRTSRKVQTHQIWTHCVQSQWSKPRIVREPLGTSGKMPFRQRPGGRRILLAIKAGDVLIVTKLDRLGRSLLDVLDTVNRFTKRGVRLVVLQFGGMTLDLGR